MAGVRSVALGDTILGLLLCVCVRSIDGFCFIVLMHYAASLSAWVIIVLQQLTSRQYAANVLSIFFIFAVSDASCR